MKEIWKSRFSKNQIKRYLFLHFEINWESKLKDRFKVLKNDEKISEKELHCICSVGTTPGILYGNPKVHKTVVSNTPKFRPILSAVNTPTYSLAKFLHPILSPLTTNEFTVKNSFDFPEEVVIYDHNLYMTSLDAESLFRNIPLEETIKNCVKDLFSNKFYGGNLSRKDLYEMLKLATTESSFIFDNKLYKQIDGVAMGYVDNIFSLFKSKEHLKLFVDYMNSKHRNIKFNFETEKSNNFSILDVKLPDKTNSLLLLFFAKLHLVECLLITIVFFLIPTR